MTEQAAIFAEWFGVSPAAGRVVARLYAGRRLVVSHALLREAAGQTQNGVNVSIKRLRAAMDEGSIENAFGDGFKLSEVGMADCDRALVDAAARELAA